MECARCSEEGELIAEHTSSEASNLERVEAIEILKAGALLRAEEHGLRAFTVVYKGRMPVRSRPSRSASVVGSRGTDDLVLAREVTDDGWVRLSELDTYVGFELHMPDEAWMLSSAADVGELLREKVLDGNGRDVDDEDWLPEMC